MSDRKGLAAAVRESEAAVPEADEPAGARAPIELRDLVLEPYSVEHEAADEPRGHGLEAKHERLERDLGKVLAALRERAALVAGLEHDVREIHAMMTALAARLDGLAAHGESVRKLGARIERAEAEHERFRREISALREQMSTLGIEGEDAVVAPRVFTLDGEDSSEALREAEASASEAERRPEEAAPVAADPPLPPLPPPAALAPVPDASPGARLLDDPGATAEPGALLRRYVYRVSVHSREDGAGRPCGTVNLIDPGVWRMIASLRSQERPAKAQLFGYALPRGAQSGLWLGAVDILSLPLTEKMLSARVLGLDTRVSKLLLVSKDSSAVIEPIRGVLAKSRISTSVAIDNRQVADLLQLVHPQAAMIHLSLSGGEVLHAIAEIRGSQRDRDIPVFFLLDPAADEAQDAFLSKTMESLLVRASTPLEELERRISSAVASIATPPSGSPTGDREGPERRNVRA